MNLVPHCLLESSFALLAAAPPVIDGNYLVQLASRVLHIGSAMILVGGLFYIRSILQPSGADVYAGQRSVWARWVGAATLFLVVSGIYNYMHWIQLAKAAGEKLPSTYHMLIGIKMLLGLLVMFIMAVLAGKTSLADKFRAKMRLWLNVAWQASLAVIALGAILRTFH